MNSFSKLYYRHKKFLKVLRLYLIIAGPGIIVMVADNDAGGITTYTAPERNSVSI
jgi:Mn2+/Fe2+ NRAMP family transporter